jgi:hypothetical protein
MNVMLALRVPNRALLAVPHDLRDGGHCAGADDPLRGGPHGPTILHHTVRYPSDQAGYVDFLYRDLKRQ